MIGKAFSTATPAPEPESGKPEISGEQWLRGNAGSPSSAQTAGGRRLWERLNPLHRKQVRVVAQTLVLRQAQARLPEPLRTRLLAALDDFERLVARIERLLNEFATRKPPGT